MTKIFIPGSYWHGNRGDFALSQAFHSAIRQRFSSVELVMTSFRPRHDALVYDLDVIPMIARPDSLAQRVASRIVSTCRPLAILQSILHVTALLPLLAYLRVWSVAFHRAPRLAQIAAWPSLWKNAQAIASSSYVLAVPGGYLNAYRATDTFWLYHLPVIYLADFLGCPVSLGPCTIGPFAGFNASIARSALRHVDRIVLRETLSLSILSSINADLRHPPEVAADMAFEFARSYAPSLTRTHSSSVLGISVREHNFPGARSIAAARRTFLDSYSGAIRRLLEKDPEATVSIIVQSAEDQDISLQLAALIDSPRVVVRSDLCRPSDLLSHYGDLRLVVGTRMHANILAMCAGTPVIAVSYDPKTPGVMASLGLAHWVRDIDDLGDLADYLMTRWLAAPTDRTLVRQRALNAAGSADSALALLTPELGPPP